MQTIFLIIGNDIAVGPQPYYRLSLYLVKKLKESVLVVSDSINYY